LREISELLSIARDATAGCHCPYSGFRVGAVLEDADGRLHTGVNVENASYGLTVCAERVALFSAVASGAASFTRILVHSPDGEPMPCGACRQALAEFCSDSMEVLVSGPDGGVRSFTLGELLPFAFRLAGRTP
jgi:cytidine deaminase